MARTHVCRCCGCYLSCYCACEGPWARVLGLAYPAWHREGSQEGSRVLEAYHLHDLRPWEKALKYCKKDYQLGGTN